MGSRYLTNLTDVCRGAGLSVIEVGASSTVGTGWKSRGRGSGGYDSGRPTCVMVHHTASAAGTSGWADANYCTFYSSNEPVCNLLLSNTGQVFVCAAGATNTNGSGVGCSRCPADSMNTHAIGLEASNNGVGEPWSTAQQDAYVRLVAALCSAYAIPNDHVHSHQFYAPGRKIDPAAPARFVDNRNVQWEPNGGMSRFRSEVAGGVGPTPLPPSMTGARPMFFMFRCVEHLHKPTFLTDGVSYWQVSGSLLVGTVNAMQEAMGYPDTAKPVHTLQIAAVQQWGMEARAGTTPVESTAWVRV